MSRAKTCAIQLGSWLKNALNYMYSPKPKLQSQYKHYINGMPSTLFYKRYEKRLDNGDAFAET